MRDKIGTGCFFTRRAYSRQPAKNSETSVVSFSTP